MPRGGMTYLLTFGQTKKSSERSIQLDGRYLLLSREAAAHAFPANDRRKLPPARHARPAQEA
jgi:hypothetical protein